MAEDKDLSRKQKRKVGRLLDQEKIRRADNYVAPPPTYSAQLFKERSQLMQAISPDQNTQNNPVQTTVSPSGKVTSASTDPNASAEAQSVQQEFQDTQNELKKAGNAPVGAVVTETITNDPNSTYNDLSNARSLGDAADINNRNAVSDIDKIVRDGDEAISYDRFASVDDVRRDIDKQAKKAGVKIPSVIVDQLGVSDYYPNINQSIAVGSYSGKYLGSATIFAAPGMTLPMGLYDARKRALRDAAVKRQESIDKILEFADAPEQFDVQYKDYAIRQMYKHLERNNWDPKAFNRDVEAVSEMNRLRSLAKEFTNADKIVDDLITQVTGKDGGEGNWIPEEVAQFINEYRSGKLNDFESFLEGKRKVSTYLDGLQSYANGTKWADGMLSKWKSGEVEVPISLKSGVELNDQNIKEINDAIVKAKSGAGYDAWMSVQKKYFYLDTKGVVENWANINLPEDADKAQKWIEDYITAQMPPESYIPTIERHANDNFKYYELAKKRQWEKEDKQTVLTTVENDWHNNDMNNKLAALRPQMLAIENDNSLTPKQKQDKKSKLMASQLTLGGLNAVIDKDNPKLVYGVLGQDVNTKRPIYQDPEKMEVKINGKWLRYDELINQKKPQHLTDDQWDAVKEQAASSKVIIMNKEHRVYPSYITDQGVYRATTDNLGAYATNEKRLSMQSLGNPVYSIKTGVDSDGNDIYEYKTIELETRYSGVFEGVSEFKSQQDALLGPKVQSVSTGYQSSGTFAE